MNKEEASYRQILRTSSIIGGASVINIAIGLLRTKVVAVMMGPAGVGLIGLFTNIMTTAAVLAGAGVGTVGTRQIASASERGDLAELVIARRALFWGTLALSILGGAFLLLLRAPIAYRIWGDTSRSKDIAWLGFGVALAIASASQGALLNGLRRIKELALVSVLGAALATVLGIGALRLFGQQGLVIFVLASPLASFLLGHLFIARLAKIEAPPTPMLTMMGQWSILARLGFTFMLAGVASTFAQLLVRTMVQKDLGIDAMGFFQAAWAISMTYIGFVLGAMGTDFYPRLAGIIHDHDQCNRLVNEQTDIAVLLSGPVFITMLALAPWVIRLLYAGTFAPAAAILRWQVMGDVLKVASWPLGFILLAAGDGRNYLLAETSASAVFVLVSWVGLPLLGVRATGIAFLAMYSFLLPLVFWMARRRTRFTWDRQVVRHFSALALAVCAVFVLGSLSPVAGALVGCLMALAFGMNTLAQLSRMTNMGGPVGRMGAFARTLMEKVGA